MLGFLEKCEKCHTRSFYIKKRTYTIPVVGTATSQRKLCSTCYRTMKLLNRKIVNES